MMLCVCIGFLFVDRSRVDLFFRWFMFVVLMFYSVVRFKVVLMLRRCCLSFCGDGC